MGYLKTIINQCIKFGVLFYLTRDVDISGALWARFRDASWQFWLEVAARWA
jgi:hypothetical protein